MIDFKIIKSYTFASQYPDFSLIFFKDLNEFRHTYLCSCYAYANEVRHTDLNELDSLQQFYSLRKRFIPESIDPEKSWDYFTNVKIKLKEI